MTAPDTLGDAPKASAPSLVALSEMFDRIFDNRPGGLWQKIRQGTADAQERKRFSEMASGLHEMFEAISSLPIPPNESMGGKAKREMLEVAGVKSWFAMARAVSLETGHDDKNLQKLYDTAAVIRRTLALLAYTESLETELEGARQKSSQTDETLRRVSEGLGALLPKDFQ